MNSTIAQQVEAGSMPSGATIEVIVRGILQQGDAVLLCENVSGQYWYLPGGHVEFNESATNALAREFMEELGIEVAVGALMNIHEMMFDQQGVRRHEINLVFHVEHDAPLPERPAGREGNIAFCWATLRDIDELTILPSSATPLLKGILTSRFRPPCQWTSER